MTACLGGQACEIATAMVTLHDGSEVCNACPQWALECEAARILTYPLAERREALSERLKKRGQAQTDALKDRITSLWKAKKSTLSDD